MLKALYDYGKAHPETRQRENWSKRTMKYVVELDANGSLVAVRRSEFDKIMCPDAGSVTRGSGTTPNVLIEKASIAIGLDDGSTGAAMERLETKRKNFTGYFRDGAVMVPEFAALVKMYGDDATMSAVRNAAADMKMKARDNVGFSVGGTLLPNLPSIPGWWSSVNTTRDDNRPDDVKPAIDVVTGELCTPTRLFKPLSVSAAGGGQGGGVYLVSFNKPAFESYGMKDGQCRNVPMSKDTADTISDALAYLGERAPRLAGTKFVHWYDRDMPQSDDIIDASLFDLGFDDKNDGVTQDNSDDAAVNDALADSLVTAPIRGECPVGLGDRTYHILVMQPEAARLVVRRYMTGSYGTLYENFKSWFDDMALVNAAGTGRMRPKSLNKMLWALLTESEKKAKTGNKLAPLSAFVMPLMRACIENEAIPDAIALRAINANTSSVYNNGSMNPTAIQWLKLWLARRTARKGETVAITEKLDGPVNVAYDCGRLMATYELVQTTVEPNMNAGVLTRYYTGCSQSPALVLGNMQAMSVHHFKKMKSPLYASVLSEALEDVWSGINGQIPKTMSMEDRSYFALGYWHQRAELNRRIAEKKAERAEKKNAAEQAG